MWDEHPTTRALLAVFPTAAVASEVGHRLESTGVPPSAIRIGSPHDVRTCLEAEVHEEASQTFNVPQAGVIHPRAGARAGAALGPPLMAVGGVLGALVGAISPSDAWPLWLKVLAGLVIGAGMGASVAVVVVPAMSVRTPLDRSVADTGVTLRVADGSDATMQALLAEHPLRLDRLAEDDVPIDTIPTAEPRAKPRRRAG
jgi:hypothetical protein